MSGSRALDADVEVPVALDLARTWEQTTISDVVNANVGILTKRGDILRRLIVASVSLRACVRMWSSVCVCVCVRARACLRVCVFACVCL